MSESRLLVTSREPLHIDGEWEVAVDPLRGARSSCPLRAAGNGRPRGFAANGEVVEMCRRLDYLPLAIELAAARVSVLALPALLERLAQRLPCSRRAAAAPERQRTLRATIAWWYDLLPTDEQATLRPTRGVRAEAARSRPPSRSSAPTSTGLQSLLDKSLLSASR